MSFLTAINMEGLIGFSMMPTAHELGRALRKKYTGSVLLGMFLAVVGVEIAIFTGVFLIKWFLPAELSLHALPVVALLAATDPVSNTAIQQMLKHVLSEAAKRLGIVLETESVFNDPYALVRFYMMLGATNIAVSGLITASIIAAAVVILVLVSRKTMGSNAGIVVRIVATLGGQFVGFYFHAALITLPVLSNFVIGWVEGEEDHAHDPYEVPGYVVLGTTILAALVAVFTAAVRYPANALAGAGFVVINRFVSRTLVVGAFFAPTRAYAVGGSPAIGVASIGVLHYQEHHEPQIAAFLAGASLGTLIVYGPWAFWDLPKLGK